ncbi:olfactory receptor 56A5-like [Protopterus annectens]|uniref:olfactory receptor 56A5-like n=1 Tax=Protopterus annectens TaxID=7888 RepID=UPI001CFA1EF6|nr:olfactory receptor 56A5-like [Protopterus annectens]
MIEKKTDNLTATEFVLTGFPGLTDQQYWLSLPFFIFFVLIILGNAAILFVISTEPCLHEPMYIFIFILALTDIIPGMSILPQLLIILWTDSNTIGFDACFVQMFLTNFSGAMESSLLLLMAYDRYIAVCKPLRYSSIVTNAFVLKGSLLILCRSFCFVLPIPILARMLSYCSVRNIPNAYCEYLAVIKITCSKSVASDIYQFTLIFFLVIPDAVMIGISYYMILRTALMLGSSACKKALNTCSSHFFVILFFYLTGILSLLVYFFENIFPPYLRALFSVLYICIPPTLNPIIYGIRTKEIRRSIINHFRNVKMDF